MMIKADPIIVHSNVIACDGGGGQLGHPRVFLSVGDDGRATCPYCGQVYIVAREKAKPEH